MNISMAFQTVSSSYSKSGRHATNFPVRLFMLSTRLAQTEMSSFSTVEE